LPTAERQAPMTDARRRDDRAGLRSILAVFGGVRPARAIALFWVLASCAIALATGAALWELRSQALARAERELGNVARLLTEQTTRAVQAVDAALRGTIERLRADRSSGYLMDERAIHTLLRARLDGMPQARSLSVFGSDGAMLRTSMAYPVPAIAAADRAYFSVHRDDDRRGLFIDRPVRSRVDGKWVILASRRLDGLGAAFDGVVAAGLDPVYFEKLYASIALGKGGAIQLYLDDGTLLAGWPRDEAVIGRSFADAPVFRARASGTSAQRLLADEASLSAFGEAGRLPLVVVASMSRDSILAPWRRQAGLAALVAAGVILLLGLAAFALTRELAREAALTAELRDSHRQLRELAAALQDVREAEQMRIARELHDELGQHLTGLKMDISWLGGKLPADHPELARKAEGMKKLVDTAVKSVRRIASELRPLVLDDLGLVAGLEWLVQDFSRRTGIEVAIDMDIGDAAPAEAQASALFRIVQESLTNVARHAGASRVRVTLTRAGGRLRLAVQDNGKGIAAGAGKAGSFGLLGIRERAIMLGGEASVAGQPGEGTRVEVSLPYPAPAEAAR
jgi:signal transduction histidine kinase